MTQIQTCFTPGSKDGSTGVGPDCPTCDVTKLYIFGREQILKWLVMTSLINPWWGNWGPFFKGRLASVIIIYYYIIIYSDVSTNEKHRSEIPEGRETAQVSPPSEHRKTSQQQMAGPCFSFLTLMLFFIGSLHNPSVDIKAR